MQGLLVILGLLALASVSVAFRPYMKHMRLKPRSLRMSSSDDADEADTDLTALAGEEIPAPKYSTVAISGCISKESKAADVQVFNTMFGTVSTSHYHVFSAFWFICLIKGFAPLMFIYLG
jgi:hypothetical protein